MRKAGNVRNLSGRQYNGSGQIIFENLKRNIYKKLQVNSNIKALHKAEQENMF